MDDWQLIEFATGERVLGYFPDLQAGYHDTEWSHRLQTWTSRAYPNQPTHFMPLPNPPAETKERRS